VILKICLLSSLTQPHPGAFSESMPGYSAVNLSSTTSAVTLSKCAISVIVVAFQAPSTRPSLSSSR
jgi:hypothetical protein